MKKPGVIKVPYGKSIGVQLKLPTDLFLAINKANVLDLPMASYIRQVLCKRFNVKY